MNKALELESRFSLPPNSLGYCGRNSATFKFKDCIINGNCKGVRKEVTKFIVLNPYLTFLGKIAKLPKFSYTVIEGYWLGNNLLTKAKTKDYKLLLALFKKQGVPDFFIKELALKPPKVLVPNHLFHVLHIGVGKASGAVPFTMETINNCMIRWGNVLSKTQKTAVIELNSLKQKDKNMYQLTVVKEKIPFDSQIVKNLEIGDIVAVHWNMVVKILDQKEEKNLKFWTKKVIGLTFS